MNVKSLPLLAMLAAALLLLAIACAKQNRCPYEGAECPNVQKYLRDYQLEYHYDTLWVYDADRLVGTFIDTTESARFGAQMDSLILNDNQ